MGGEEAGARNRQGFTGGQLGLGVGQAKGLGDAHHFAGAAHFRPQQGVGPGEALEGQHGLLHRLEGGDGFGVEAQLGEGLSRHQLARHLGQGYAGGLGHKGHGARGPGVGFDDEHGLLALGITLHGELEIDQAAHPQGQGQILAPLADGGQGIGAQAHRGQATGRIARVDTGRFDVFHHAANHHLALAITEGIHIHLGGVLQVLVNQHRVVGFHLHRFHHVAVELGFVVDHFHGPATEHVAGAHDHGITHPIGHGPGLGFTAGQAVAGLADLEPPEDGLELLPIFGAIDRFR